MAAVADAGEEALFEDEAVLAATAIVAVPRLCSRLLAGREAATTAEEIWADTRIEVPRRFANVTLRNLLDGATMRPDGPAERPGVRAAALFATFPVALLTT